MATYWENSCSFGLRYVSWYKYLIVSLVFSHLGFWSGNLFLIAPFPDLCLLVPFSDKTGIGQTTERKKRNVGSVDNRPATRDWRGGTLYCKGTNFYSGSRLVQFKEYVFCLRILSSSHQAG